ncbi:MAG: type II toxin-antitoxin system VapC family toxin [Proteobacteria bacterium]|nr:type II toxin-antitoxin system VapC family toxin [Pseudomonadota bacterium]
MLILDTDHISAFMRGSLNARALRHRLLETSEAYFLTIVTVEEVNRGWLAKINGARSAEARLAAYGHCADTIEALRSWSILRWTARCETVFEMHGKLRSRVGTMDLRIACIALANDATLLSRNQRDFDKVPGLRVENWLV